MFDFLKPTGVPDVGKEKEFDDEKSGKKKKANGSEDYPDGVTEVGVEEVPEDSSEEKDEEVPAVKKSKVKKFAPLTPSMNDVSFVRESSNLEIEKVNTRLEALNARIGQLSERFSYLSESIGEIRTMNLENEKKISNATKDADKVIDIVKEIKPEELRIDYQKSDMKIKALEEKIEANKQFMESLLEEMKDLQRKSEIFTGTDGLMKLNEDTKKDLVEVQRINARTKLNADKAQEIFMEIKKGFAESQKVNAIINDLNESYYDLKDRIEKLTLRYGKIVSQDDFGDFKKSINSQISDFKSSLGKLQDIKDDNAKVAEVAETALSVSRRNEEDIGEIAMKVGDENTKKVSDFENQISSVLEIIDGITDQMVEVRKKVGLKGKKLVMKTIPEAVAIEKPKPFKVDESGIPDVEVGEQDNLENKSSVSVDEALSKISAAGKNSESEKISVEPKSSEEENSSDENLQEAKAKKPNFKKENNNFKKQNLNKPISSKQNFGKQNPNNQNINKQILSKPNPGKQVFSKQILNKNLNKQIPIKQSFSKQIPNKQKLNNNLNKKLAVGSSNNSPTKQSLLSRDLRAQASASLLKNKLVKSKK